MQVKYILVYHRIPVHRAGQTHPPGAIAAKQAQAYSLLINSVRLLSAAVTALLLGFLAPTKDITHRHIVVMTRVRWLCGCVLSYQGWFSLLAEGTSATDWHGMGRRNKQSIGKKLARGWAMLRMGSEPRRLVGAAVKVERQCGVSSAVPSTAVVTLRYI